MIFFKAEENSIIGGGHLHRCLILADECRNAGLSAEFIFAQSTESAYKKVSNAGYTYHIIPKEKEYEYAAYQNYLTQNSLVVFDTDDPLFYAGKLIDQLSEKGIKTACFSVSDANPVATDLFINPNIISRIQHFNTVSHTRKLLGPRFMVYHKDFRNIKKETKPFNLPLRLLLYFGNADYHHLTTYFLSILGDLNKYLEKIIVVAGAINPEIEKIKQLSQQIDSIDVELHINTPKIASLYEKCDVSIASGGMAMWEMALYQIKQMIIASSEREIPYVDYLNKLGYIHKLCNYDYLPSVANMKDRLIKIIEEKQIEKLKTDEFSNSVNSDGAKLIVDNFLKALHKR